MENITPVDIALNTLRTMLELRKLSIETEGIQTEDKKMEKVRLYTIGSILVCFSTKDKMLAQDIDYIVNGFAKENGHTNGIIIVALSRPSENVLKTVKSHAKNRVQFFHVDQLQTAVWYTTHRFAIPHRILTEDEKVKVFAKYKVRDPKEELPWIDSQDPAAKWIGAIPGDVLEVIRHSDTAGRSIAYRYCVEDVNVTQ